MVTFGVVPGLVMFKLIEQSFLWKFGTLEYFADGTSRIESPDTLMNLQIILKSLAFIIIVFSAIRLAKFNNDTRQTTSFIGLPTPANAILICSFPLILKFGNSNLANDVIQNPYFLVITSIVLSVFLIAEIPLFALKFRSFSWNGNRTRYIFLMISVVLLILFRFTGIPLIILLYVLMSINSNYFAKRKERS
jgi:CDP-diacylglycerol--serine O-phosphatidyltransferase